MTIAAPRKDGKNVLANALTFKHARLGYKAWEASAVLGKFVSTFAAIAALTFLSSPAPAKNMMLYNARTGCRSLVDQVHPDIKGKARGDEIRKCKADPDAYSKASGL